MNRDFWMERWEEGQIGFHQSEVNGYLTRHWEKLQAGKGDKVLVPLCGKSKDMLWLADQGHKVLGVELSPLAVDAFFTENNIPCSQFENDGFKISESDHVSLWCGDFFDLTQKHLQGITRVYDRASLIALPPEMREKYSLHMKTMMPAGARVLLVTMEYPQAEMSGPPFSVSHNEVHDLYDDAFDISLLEEVDILALNPQFKERGLSALVEKSYLMIKK